MTIQEIYSEIFTNQLRGIMLHADMAKYYDFLGLDGYRVCHEYHYYDEVCNHRKLYHYMVTRHNILLKPIQATQEQVIPDSWYNYTRQDVDASTKKNAVRTGLQKWVSWEKSTKALYERKYKELLELGEVADAEHLICLIKDVDRELKKAETYLLCKESTNYDMGSIISEQKDKKHKYKEKFKYIEWC